VQSGANQLGIARRAAIAAGLACLAALSGSSAADAAFPGANGRIAYQGPGLSGVSASSIFSTNPDGTDKLNLTPNPVFRRGEVTGNRQPAYSPDGRRIAFARTSVGAFRNDIWVMNADGTDQINLTSAAEGNYVEPSFSPDGARIVFSDDRDDIQVIDSGGSPPVDLTSGPALDSDPEFSPDGTKIAFERSEGGPSDIYVMNADGSLPTNMTAAVPNSSESPSWSPDGTRIAFTNDDPVTESNILVIGAAGGATTDLTSAVTGKDPQDPAFSPDGTKIAYSRLDDGMDADVFTMGSDGLQQKNLTPESTEDDRAPNWGPVPVEPPNTKIKAGPKKRTSKRRATFRFNSGGAAVGFQCSLSGRRVKEELKAFAACESPITYKRLKPGRKRFRVRAVDRFGAVDASPAKLAWRITGG